MPKFLSSVPHLFAQPLSSPEEQARALTRAEFCAAERMSLSTYHKLKRLGWGPDEIKFPGMAFTRITAGARQEWHRRIEEYRKSQAAEIDQQRRSAQATRAGKLAAASPRHVSRRTVKADSASPDHG